MADSSFSSLPLCERISYKSYFLRVVDLTILGLLICLLLYRILHLNQNDAVWVVAFLCESFFTFIWLLATCSKWSPADYKPYPHRLDERVHDLPSVDMFVTTADPVREPPMIVVNTVLSLLAVNYPANKLACYVSDDGCSPLTYFSLKEASKFAKIWVPFCKKYNVKLRAPFRYFLNPLEATEDPEFSREWELIKGVCLGIIITLVGIYCLYTIWEYKSLGFSVQSWYASQSFGRIKTTSSWLFSIFDIIFKLLGISKTVFIVTKKTIPQTKLGSKDGPLQNSGKFEFDDSLYFLPGTVIMLVNLAVIAGFSTGLQRFSSGDGDGSSLIEACGCIVVVMLFLPFLMGLFEKGKYGLPLSTLSKATFLAVLFVVYSVRK